MHPLLHSEPGTTMLLLGNEAIVRGAIEAGLRVGTTYPGTPSSEIGNNLFFISQEEDSPFYFEFSTNEKVAMEVAAAASAAGKRSLCCMKHVGLNVASDALMTLAYIGTKGGMVIVTADDPSMHSSQNEQDNRIYARLANLPMLEPRTPQEAKDMTIEAFKISERLELPVILRTTTRTAHVRGAVRFERPIEVAKEALGRFEKNPRRWVPVPAVARIRHKVLLDRMEECKALSEESSFNTMRGTGRDLAIVSSGVASNYTFDAIEELGLEERVRHLDLGFTHPLPRAMLIELLKGQKRVLVVEELEPVVEDELRALCQEEKIDVEIFGKRSGHFSRLYEFTPRIVREAIMEILNLEPKVEREMPDLSWVPELPMRPPVLCKGCPHRETYNAVKEALKEIGEEENAIYPTDIGCYTLGLLPPINMADYLICMGSSVGSSCGFSASTEHKVVSFIGDSTFFHSGIAPLVNAVHNGHRFCLVIMDNSTTAMTGHQPNPGITLKPKGFDKPTISIEDVVRGCGVRHVAKINPYRKKEAVESLKEVLALDELTVVISEAPCILYAKRVKK